MEDNNQEKLSMIDSLFIFIILPLAICFIVCSPIILAVQESPGRISKIEAFDKKTTLIETTNGKLGKKTFLVKGFPDTPIGTSMALYINPKDDVFSPEKLGKFYFQLCYNNKENCLNAAKL